MHMQAPSNMRSSEDKSIISSTILLNGKQLYLLNHLVSPFAVTYKYVKVTYHLADIPLNKGFQVVFNP